MSYISTILADGPLAYWRLNEAVGSPTVADSGPGGYTLNVDSGVTLGAASMLTNDPNSTSASFPGTSSPVPQISGGGGAAALTDANGQGLEWWAYYTGLPSSNAGDLDFVSITTAGDEYGRYSGDGKCYPAQFMGTRIDAFAAVPSGGGLHHFVVTRKTGVNFIWYLDGIVLASTATFPAFSASLSVIHIGGNTNGTPLGYAGRISHVSLWNKALSGAQVAAHYSAGLVIPDVTGSAVKGPTRIGNVNEGFNRATGQGPNFASIDNPGANRVGG